jgi:hypothetical protein
MKGERYALAASRLGWLMRELERALLASPQECTVDAAFARAHATKRVPTHDEAAVALDAFAELGILRDDRGVLRLRKKGLEETEGFRSGVWQALRVSSDAEEAPCIRVCVALPPELDAAVRDHIRREASDLRAAILEIIVSARRHLVLASPFWDEETADDIADLVKKRIEAGVDVTVLGRFSELGTSAVAASLRQLAAGGRCRVLSWFDVHRGERDVQTFHFKAAVADEGQTAYLGTANFTMSGLRSRMELGVILAGEPARQVYHIISAVLGLVRSTFQ